MGAAIMITRRDLAPPDLRKAAGQVKDGRVARRILAIALVLEGVGQRCCANLMVAAFPLSPDTLTGSFCERRTD